MNKVRVLITTQPGTGHLSPLLPLAQALVTAGHTVAFACAASFVPQVQRAGFTAFAAGLDWLQAEPERAFPEMANMTTAEKDAMLTEIFVDISAGHMINDLSALCEAWQPDVLVRDYSEYGACLVGEMLAIPHAAVGLAAYLPDYITRLAIEKPLAYLRSACGLPSHPAMPMLTKYLYLSLVPPSLQFPEYPLPATTTTLQPLPPPTLNTLLPDWLSTLPDQPTIYASLGTVFNRAPEIFRTIIAGLRQEPVNLIITIGRNQDPAQFGAVPENIHIEQFIPQDLLMPHCAGVITHGGINTILMALRYGLPLVLLPLVGHQWQNVARCTALGVGIPLRLPEDDVVAQQAHLPLDAPQSAALTLYAEAATPLSAHSVKTAVTELLGNGRYQQAAQKVQAEMAALPGPDYGVHLLERLAVERKPLPFSGLKYDAR